MVAQSPDDWEKPRSKGTHLTPEEIALLKTSFKAGHSTREAAKALKCSSRTAFKYYSYFKNELAPPRLEQPPEPRPPLPNRFYRTSFDL